MIIVAIDESEYSTVKNIIDSLDNKKCMVKIGSVAFNSIGHDIISYAHILIDLNSLKVWEYITIIFLYYYIILMLWLLLFI